MNKGDLRSDAKWLALQATSPQGSEFTNSQDACERDRFCYDTAVEVLRDWPLTNKGVCESVLPAPCPVHGTFAILRNHALGAKLIVHNLENLLAT